jgi:hypothetical protein
MHTQILVECKLSIISLNSTNFYFYFDGKLIPLTSDHKHLGITFSEEAKWNKQGPRTDPWGIPADTDTYEDDESLFTTF